MAVDYDNIFKYAAPKYVYIRDAKLGALKYMFMIFIFIYVIVYQICIKCTHLKPNEAAGFGTLQIFQPQHECDQFDTKCLAKFTPVNTLKYCKQYQGSDRRMATDAEEDGKEKEVGDYLTTPKTCRYFDSMRLQWEPGVTSEIFIPTRVNRISQSVNKDCYDPLYGGASDKHSLDCVQPWDTIATDDFYVADIGHFEIQLIHSYSSPSLGLAGTSLDHQGYFAACKTDAPMSGTEIKAECKRFKIPGAGSGEVAPEDDEGLSNPEDYGIQFKSPTMGGDAVADASDTITVLDLLKLSPVAQRYNLSDVLDRKLPDNLGHPDSSLRDTGGMLLVDINYDNTAKMRPGFPFMGSLGAIKPITYTYRPHFVPMTENLKYELIQSGDDPTRRTVDVWYGITVKLVFQGKLVKFSYGHLLTALTTGLLLVTAATTIVTALATYVLPLKEKYSLLMYQFSEDFTDYKKFKEKVNPEKPPPSMYWVGAALRERLKPSADTKSEAEKNKELLAIFCSNEMRLARLDGMDPMTVYYQGTEMDPRSYLIGDYAAKFYKEGNIDVNELSYRCQGSKRTPLTVGKDGKFEDMDKCGELK